MCFLLGGHRFKTRGGQNLYLARCDEVHEVGVPLECLQDVSALANSHVLASIGLQLPTHMCSLVLACRLSVLASYKGSEHCKWTTKE